MRLLGQALQQPSQEQRLSRLFAEEWHNDIVVFVSQKLPKLVGVLIITFVILRIIKFFVTRLQKRAEQQVGNFHRAAQLRTMASIFRATSIGVIGFLAFLQVLTIFDIPYQPLLASAGILGVGIGLGAQSIFKDMLNGIFILLEDEHGFINVVVPSRVVEPNREVTKFELFLLVKGRFEREGMVMNVVGEKFRPLKARALAYASRDFH